MAAVGQAEAGSGLNGEGGFAAEGGVGHEGDESGFVGVERLGVAVVAAVHGAVKGGACEMGWVSPYQAQ